MQSHVHPPNLMQLFDGESCTFSYLLWDPNTLDAVLIDPVDTQLQRDLIAIATHGLRLRYVLETHAHADHITSAAALIEHTGATAATPAGCGIAPAAVQLQNGDTLSFGGETVHALHTPGHTAGSMCFVWQNHVFTGDTLLIGGCGRTDFQSGSSAALYRSITQVLFALPNDTQVWPGHDYKGQFSSSIGHEKQHNARITQQGKVIGLAAFTAVMDALNLPTPKRIHEAVPANLSLGASSLEPTEATKALSASAKPKGYEGDVTPQEAFDLWQAGKAVLLDIRTEAERAWVGFVPTAPAIEWKTWPSMAVNPQFDEQLLAQIPPGSTLLMLCRSGIRSIPAALRAQTLGYPSYNVLHGFEGDPDANGHRNATGGWRKLGLPWRQN